MPEPRTAWVAALAMLARRDLSEGEIRFRLTGREYPADEIDQAIARLRQRRYVDDSTLASEVAGRRARQRLHGPARVSAHLRRRRFPDEVIEIAVRSAFADEDAERQCARAALERMRERRNPPDPDAARRRLHHRGFSPAVIREVVANAPGEPG